MPGRQYSQDYLTAYGLVLGKERGVLDDPDDRDGPGPTVDGVTQRTYDDYRTRHHLTTRSTLQMTPDERCELYYEGYWIPMGGDAVHGGLALFAFDSAVHCGVTRTPRWLQNAIGAFADGLLGPQTMRLIRFCDRPATLKSMVGQRLQHYQEIVRKDATQKKWINGWINRLNLMRMLSEEHEAKGT